MKYFLEKITKSPEESRKVGIKISKYFQRGDIVCLMGPLGSGKTVFVQGITSGLGLKEWPTSPAFKIINEYKGKIPVYHFDLYRLRGSLEFDRLGWREYFYGEGITILEWADKIRDFWPNKRTEIYLEVISEKERKITIRFAHCKMKNEN